MKYHCAKRLTYYAVHVVITQISFLIRLNNFACLQVRNSDGTLLRTCTHSKVASMLTHAPHYCRKQSRMSVKDQITDGLSNMNSRWKLSCFSIAESIPEGQSFEPRQRNEVLGDVSFEEVRWADYQESNKQACVQRFAQANRLKSAQFQVGLSHPDLPTTTWHGTQKLLHHCYRLQGHMQLLSARVCAYGLHLKTLQNTVTQL